MSRKFHIHCFGDSLTEGLSKHFNFFPYTAFLQQLLHENNLAQFVHDPIGNFGVSGELTTQIQKRFNHMKKANLILQKPNSDEIFVFLAGTNDLGHNKTPEDTFATLYEMVFECINNGNRVIVCSIPSLAGIISDEDGSQNRWVLSRKKYNEKIENLAKELGEEVCLFYDCHKDTGVVVKDQKYGQEFTKLNPQLAADNLHLTKEGYKIVAEGVFEKLKKFLPAAVSDSAADSNKEEDDE